MKPAFEEHRIEQALEKVGAALHHARGGFGAPSWAEADGKDIVTGLEELGERMRAQHVSLQNGAFPVAIYAARELGKYVAGGQSDIPNADAAEVFYRALGQLLEELRPLDQQLAKQAA